MDLSVKVLITNLNSIETKEEKEEESGGRGKEGGKRKEKWIPPSSLATVLFAGICLSEGNQVGSDGDSDIFLMLAARL